MNDSIIKRTISGIIILAFFSSSLFIPSSAIAATTGLNWSNPNQGSSPFKITASTLLNAQTLTAIVGCTGIIDSVASAALDLAKSVTSSLLSKVDQTVPVKDAKVLTQDQKDSRRESCFNGLAYSLAKQQLVSMTKATMNWVNSGFNGDPMYVRDMNSLTSNIEGTILQKEVNLFKNSPAGSGDYPYGRNFALSQISSFRLGQNPSNLLRQNLSNYLGDTGTGRYVESYTNNFALGGWNGWLAFTQMPQNNPLGFNMIASQNLADKQNLEVSNTKSELEQGGGLLNQKKCVLWNMVDDAGDYIYEDVYENENGWVNKIKTTTKADPNFADECIKFETVTPGSLIKDKVSKYLNSGETQLELAKSLNEVLFSIFGNLINKFQTNGLSSLSSNTSDFSSASTGIGANRIIDANGKDITNGNGDNGFTDTSFDITNDLGSASLNNCLDDYPNGIGADKKTCGIIEIQQKYIATVNKLFAPLALVMPKLGELDYCIPGPNPSWESNSSNTRDAYLSYLNNITSLGSGNHYYFNQPSDVNANYSQKSVFQTYLNDLNDTTTNFWSILKDSWYFSFSDSSPTLENQSMIDKISRNVESRTDEVDKAINEYRTNAASLYGFKSPMQTEYLNNGTTTMTENPAYLAMAQTGLSITKDINAYAENIGEMTTTYQDKIIETTANIYKLNKLKTKIDAIVIRAQAARAAARAASGAPFITKACLASEKTIITQ